MYKKVFVLILIGFIYVLAVPCFGNTDSKNNPKFVFLKYHHPKSKLNRIIINVNTNGAIESDLLRDALSAKFSSHECCSVVSLPKQNKIHMNAISKTKIEEKKGSPFIDLFTVAKECNADSILTVTSFFDLLHTNIYDRDAMLVKEVRKALKVIMISYSIIDTTTEELIGGAALEYNSPIGLVEAVNDLVKIILNPK